MKVGFYLADQNPHRDRTLGVTAYTDGLLNELSQRGEFEIVTLGSRSSYSPNFAHTASDVAVRTDRSLARAVVDNFHPFFRRPRVDLWHYPKGHLPLFVRYREPVIGTVHDVILQHYADHYPSARSRSDYFYWLTVLKRSISRFDMILTVSKFSEQAILAFCERHRLRCPPIRVTYEAAQPDWTATSPVEKEDKVLHLASREPHKRTGTLLKFWKDLAETEHELPRLQVVGNLCDEDRALAGTIRGVELSSQLPREKVRAAMASARSLLLPSEIEGFGLPALEAYLLGTPVVYVQGTAVDEVIGRGTPGAFELRDASSLRAALLETLALAPEALSRKRAELVNRFTWNAVGDRTLAAYLDCCP